jgi:5-formyltetrahydrofolate cyclo-ligase
MEKAELRRSLLKTRQSMSVEEWQEKSDRICSHLQSSPLFTQAKTILAYFSFRQEPNLNPLFTDNRYRWGASRCVGDSLIWHVSKPGDILQTGAYGILEPLPSAPTLHPSEVDLILVPAVACDYQGYRLGYGGGYYDRLLNSPEWSSKTTIGIVFDFAYLLQLPIDPWDKPLQAVCTETGLKMQ